MKKLVSLITIFSLFLTIFVIKPITLKAANETPEISSNQAVDTNSQQLLDGTGYFKKSDTATQYNFYYTNYLGTDVDYSTNESLYVRKINRSVTPSEWYNSSYGLDLDNFESVSIIQGKWALPYEYAKDEKGNIIPESTGYLEESIYSDCRRYVYYLVYVNDDGVQRPKYDKHYECDVETSSIPSYLLNNGKNEKMGIQKGKIYNTTLLTYKAIKKIEYYVDAEMFVSEYWDFVNTDNVAGELKEKYEWRPIIYFNIKDIDYDYLLSVKYSYEYAEYKQSFIGFFKGEYDKLVEDSETTVEDEVFNDEYINYNTTTDGPLFVNDNLSDLLLCSFVKDYKDSLVRKENWDNKIQTSFLSTGSWSFEDIKYRNDEGKLQQGDLHYENRIIGHPFSDNPKKMFRLLHNDDSVNFLKIVYCYDGVIYASDSNVPIIGENQTPDPPTTEDLWDDVIKDILDQLGKIPAQIVDTASEGFLTALASFWTNLSSFSKTIIIIAVIVFLLAITSSFWLPGIRWLFFRKNDKAYDESLKISSRKAYNKQHRRERKELKEDRKYETRTSIMNKAFEIDSRNYQSKEADKERRHWNDHYEAKYAHEQSLQDKRNVSFEQQRQHEVYMSEHQSKEAEKNRKFSNKQNKAKNEAAERKYKENSLWRRYWNKSNKEKYAHEERIQTNQLKENEANRKYWKNKNKQSANKKTVKKSTGTKMDPDVVEALRNIKIKKPWE